MTADIVFVTEDLEIDALTCTVPSQAEKFSTKWEDPGTFSALSFCIIILNYYDYHYGYDSALSFYIITLRYN